MEFKFDGLDEPIALPDEYLTTRQYETLQRFVHNHEDEPEDFRYVRLALSDFLGSADFMERTDNLPMNPYNMKQWAAINDHLVALMSGSGKTGDTLTDEAINGPLERAETPTETSKRKPAKSAAKNG